MNDFAMRRFSTIEKPAAAARKEGEDLVLPIAIASGYPVERWYGTEVLSMDPAAVRLGRLNTGASLLFNHNMDDIRGSHVPDTAKISPDGVLRASVSVTSATQPGRDAIGLIEGGHLRQISSGYRIHKVVERTKKGKRELDGQAFERLLSSTLSARGADVPHFRSMLDKEFGAFERADDDMPTYDVVDWEPGESSLVTMAADPTVGVGRSLAVTTQTTEPAPNTGANSAAVAARSITMDAVQVAQAAGGADPTAAAAAAAATVISRISAVDAEKERRESIINIAKAAKISDVRVIDGWIQDGTSLADVSKAALLAMEERGRSNPTVATNVGMTNKETQRYSLFRAIRALHFGGRNSEFNREAAFEIECSKQVAKQLNRGESAGLLVPGEVLQRSVGEQAATRAMSITPGSKGGYMVGIENMGFIDILRNRSVAMRMGSRVLSGLQGNVAFPRQTGKVSVTWQAGAGTSVTAADQALGQLSMTPKTCIAITDVDEQLLRQASPSAEAFVMADLAADVAIDGVDAAVINGTGGAQPIGIMNTAGITSGQDAASATYAKILAFVSTVGALNAIRGNPGWVTTTAGAARLMQVQRFTSTDTPLWTGNMLDGNLVGFNAMSSEQLSSANIIFGSWDEVVIGEWGVLELSTDNGGTRFNTAQVGIRAMWMVDVMLRYPTSFCVGTNLS
jgi:HK97 family phage major capsid protein